MGNTYFYGKIVSMFGNDIGKGKGGTNKLMSYMLLSQMMGDKSNASGMNAMLPFMMMGGNGFSDMFSGIFDFDLADEAEEEDAEDKE